MLPLQISKPNVPPLILSFDICTYSTGGGRSGTAVSATASLAVSVPPAAAAVAVIGEGRSGIGVGSAICSATCSSRIVGIVLITRDDSY